MLISMYFVYFQSKSNRSKMVAITMIKISLCIMMKNRSRQKGLKVRHY